LLLAWCGNRTKGNEAIKQKHIAHIAIAEDEMRILKLISFVLRSAGYIATGVSTGAGLVAAVLSSHSTDCPVDVIICDFYMPDQTGLQIMKELAAQKITVPLVIMSGLSDENILAQLKAEGCSYFLSKPFNPEELLQMVEKILRRS
jgi:two-component system cell cycle response regulator CtrA